MFRRLRLPGKLVLAAFPLVLALSGVSALLVQSAFAEAADERRVVDLTAALVDLRSTVDALAAEALGPDEQGGETDARIGDLRDSIALIDAPPLSRQLTQAGKVSS